MNREPTKPISPCHYLNLNDPFHASGSG